MKTFAGNILFFLIITVQGVRSENIERLGDASISKAIGESATIVWNVKGITASFNNALSIAISKGELSLANIVFQFGTRTVDSAPEAVVESKSVHKELASRSTAIYTYTGKSSTGQETARVSFTINNLTLEDEGSYILAARSSSLSTNISVHYGPEKCGSVLQSEYIDNPKDQLNINSGFCGKPQPTVTCTFDGTALSNVIIAEVSQYNYTYTVGIPKLELCDKKELRCTISGNGRPFVDSAFFLREFSSDLTSFIKNIMFIQECQCQTVKWENKTNAGKCDVRYQLQFFNGTNTATTPVKLEKNIYRNCLVEFEIVRISTFVYGNVSGTYKLLGNRTSDTVQVNITACTTTTTSTTTTKATTITSSSTRETSTVPNTKSQASELNEKEKDLNSNTVIIIVLGVIIALLVVVILLYIVLVKFGRVKVELIRKGNPEKNIQSRNNVAEENITVKLPSDYMELQAARKDTTYQALTSVQSAAALPLDNSVYEVYDNDK